MTKKIPDYYIGKRYKYEARKVVEDFQADNYNLGTAITYLLRAGKKKAIQKNKTYKKQLIT